MIVGSFVVVVDIAAGGGIAVVDIVVGYTAGCTAAGEGIAAAAAAGDDTVVADSRRSLVALEEPIVLEVAVPIAHPGEEDLPEEHHIRHAEDSVHDLPVRDLVPDTCCWFCSSEINVQLVGTGSDVRLEISQVSIEEGGVTASKSPTVLLVQGFDF